MNYINIDSEFKFCNLGIFLKRCSPTTISGGRVKDGTFVLDDPSVLVVMVHDFLVFSFEGLWETEIITRFNSVHMPTITRFNSVHVPTITVSTVSMCPRSVVDLSLGEVGG